jgi:carbamoyltransferase
MQKKQKNEILIGLGGSDHDFCAALIINGRIVVAIEDERINRIKHGRDDWHSLPCLASLNYCLTAANLKLEDVSYIYSNKALERRTYDGITINRPLISHHLAHASSVFLDSPYQEAAILVVDGAGSRVKQTESSEELESASIGYGQNSEISLTPYSSGSRHLATCNWEYFLTNSLGHFYKSVTFAIGFGKKGAGKTMGLASYGNNSLVSEFLKYMNIDQHGKFNFNAYGGFYEWITAILNNAKNPFMIRANLARAAQVIFEDAICELAKATYEKYPTDVLCLSGGCGLNTVANAEILRRTQFKNICVHPASADSGTAIGAALYGWHCDLKNQRAPMSIQEYEKIAFRGKEYNDTEIKVALENSPFYYRDLAGDLSRIINDLSEGKVIGWWQGRSESGQRALSHRSIIAIPTSQAIRDRINLEIKNRESFRPLAPIVADHLYQEYFDIPEKSPFMTLVANVKEKYKFKLAGVTHIDGTARVQTLSKESNPIIFELLLKMEESIGVPILINTSFNVQGQPIIESPAEALESFANMKLDALYINGYYVEKHTPWANRELASPHSRVEKDQSK